MRLRMKRMEEKEKEDEGKQTTWKKRAAGRRGRGG